MKILTALTYYHPHWTGLTVYAKRIAEGLAERGHDVTVLTSQFDRSLPREEDIDGVRVVRVPTIGRLSRTAVMPTFPVVARQLVAAHDVVHVHSPMPEASLLVSLAARHGLASVITHQGDVVMPAGLRNRAVQVAMDRTLRSAVRRADVVVTHSRSYADHSPLLRTRAPRPVEVITPPTTVPEPDPAGVAALRVELGLGGGPVVGFAGRFVEEKGFDVLLAAMPAVAAAVPGVRFVFAGETDVVYEALFERCRPAWSAMVAAGRSTRSGCSSTASASPTSTRCATCSCCRRAATASPACRSRRCCRGTPVVSTDIPGAERRRADDRHGPARASRATTSRSPTASSPS